MKSSIRMLPAHQTGHSLGLVLNIPYPNLVMNDSKQVQGKCARMKRKQTSYLKTENHRESV